VVYNARALLSSAHSVEELQMSLCLLLERLFSGDHGGVRGDTEEEEDSDGDRTARRGVVVVCDCRGVASLSALLAAKKQRTPSKDARKGARADATHATHATKAASKAALGLEDVHRGCAMMAESFPCRLRGLYVLNLPLALRPFAALAAAACLTRKQRGRLHISSSSSSSLGNIFGGSVVSSGNSSGSSSGSGASKQQPRLLEDVDRSVLPPSLGGTNTSFDWDKIVDRLLVADPNEPAARWLEDADRR
jgi:hypothetical protein